MPMPTPCSLPLPPRPRRYLCYELERVTKARDERAKRVEAAQKKKREAKVNKKRSKAVARGSKSVTPELSQEKKAVLHRKYFDLVKELVTVVNDATGETYTTDEAFAHADNEFIKWEHEAKWGDAVQA